MKQSKLLKSFFLALLLSASVFSATAHDFEVNGIYYLINGTNATVTYCGTSYDQYSNEYSGNVVIPTTVTYGGTTYSVTSIGDHAFSSCSGLTSITIPNSVTSIGNVAFRACSGLTSVTIGNSVTSIGDGAFSNCSGLASVSIPNSVTSIGKRAFSGCSSLTSITIPNSVTSIGYVTFYGCSSLTSVTIPNSVTSIGGHAFSGCSSLTSITIPNSVTSIGDGAFSGCSSLTSITIPNSVTSIGDGAFSGCSSLTSVTIPNSVTSIGGHAFSGCSSLTSITIPNSVTSIGGYAFEDCSSLTGELIIPNSVTSIGIDAFSGCSSLTSITIPNSVTSIGEGTFSDCSSLTSVTIPNSVTSIGNGAFDSCSGLTSVTIPNSVISIGAFAFEFCDGLTSVTIPNSVTSIGTEAFFVYNPNGKTLTLCGGVENIGNNAFKSYFSGTNIKTLILKDSVVNIKNLGAAPNQIYSYATTPPECDENSFSRYTGTLHVPSSAIAAYFEAPYWQNFTNIVGDAVEPTSLTISTDTAYIKLGNQYTLQATLLPSNASNVGLRWMTSNASIATLNAYHDENGHYDESKRVVNTLQPGECDIIVQCVGMQARCHIVVLEEQIVITLDKHELQMDPSTIQWLNPSFDPVATDITVESSDRSIAIARVADNRVQVLALQPGRTVVTVRSVDGKAIPDSCVVTVVDDTVLAGDVNGDGRVNVSDVSALINMILGITTMDDASADVNGDGRVNVSDVSALINIILGIQ